MTNPLIFLDPPVDAFIHEDKYSQYSEGLRRIGLNTRHFRAVAVAVDGTKVIVHPEDVAEGSATLGGNPTTIRGSLVGFREPDVLVERGVNIPQRHEKY